MLQMPMIGSICRRRNNSHGPIENVATTLRRTHVTVQTYGREHFGNVKAFMQRHFGVTPNLSSDLCSRSHPEMAIR